MNEHILRVNVKQRFTSDCNTLSFYGHYCSLHKSICIIINYDDYELTP